MPNYCNYKMKIKGSKRSRHTLISYLQSYYKYIKLSEHKPKGLIYPPEYDSILAESDTSKHFFRVFECYQHEEKMLDFGESMVDGYCAWSVSSCMLPGPVSYYVQYKQGKYINFCGTNLLECSKQFNLDIEVFSEEPGCGFMEHYIISKGNIIIDECVDYYENYNEETDQYDSEGGLEWNFTI